MNNNFANFIALVKFFSVLMLIIIVVVTTRRLLDSLSSLDSPTSKWKGPIKHKCSDFPECVLCGRKLTIGIRDFCLNHPERFHGNLYCMEHQN